VVAGIVDNQKHGGERLYGGLRLKQPAFGLA
jgi:hypothetical protein